MMHYIRLGGQKVVPVNAVKVQRRLESTSNFGAKGLSSFNVLPLRPQRSLRFKSKSIETQRLQRARRYVTIPFTSHNRASLMHVKMQ